MEGMVYKENEIENIVLSIKEKLISDPNKASILCLQGDLGAGKTTLTKKIISSFGVRENVQSPTFTIAKRYKATDIFSSIIHIDAYRIEDVSELEQIRFKEMILEPQTLIIIEWPEIIKDVIPKNVLWFEIEHVDDSTRKIKQKYD